MNLSLLRGAIVVLTLATASIHLVLSRTAGVMFVLNGLGYIALVIALLVKLPFLAGRERLVHYAYIGYTVVTILAWVAIGQKSLSDPLGPIGYTTKAIELLLIAALWQHLRLTQSASAR